MRSIRVALALLLLTAGISSCATLQQIVALRQVDFDLDGVGNATLAGVSLERIASYESLSILEVGRLALAATRREVPLEFDVGVRALNPSTNTTSATLSRLSWALLLDDQETIEGTLDSSHTLLPGEPVVIPLRMSLNLVDFFDGSAESLVNLAAGIAGMDADPTRVALRAVPTIDTPLGPIQYPSPITVVSRTVGGSAAAQ